MKEKFRQKRYLVIVAVAAILLLSCLGVISTEEARQMILGLLNIGM